MADLLPISSFSYPYQSASEDGSQVSNTLAEENIFDVSREGDVYSPSASIVGH